MSIKIVSISDIHTGHQRVPTDVIHENFRRVLYPELNDSVDLLSIGGDFFDTLLDLNGKCGFHAAMMIDELKSLAETHHFFIRVTRGTFSHDRLQNQFFIKDISPIMFGQDPMIRLFDTLAVEHIASLGIDILYVPDDLPYEDAMPMIRNKIADAQLSAVDIAVVHSYFDHLLPPGIPRRPSNTYSADAFESLVKGVVLNGHVHKPCVYKKVITNGSFDRLAHGEEEQKGFFIVEYDKESHRVVHNFIHNEYATIFKTINLSKYPTEEEGLSRYTEWLSDLFMTNKSTSKQVHVRVLADDPLLKQAIVAYTRTNERNVVISSRSASKSQHLEEEILTELTDLPIITEENLPTMASRFLQEDKGITMSPEAIKEVLNASS